MSFCGVCKERRSSFILNNKLVCLACDELLFDLEIECDGDGHEHNKKPSVVLLRVSQKTAPSNDA